MPTPEVATARLTVTGDDVNGIALTTAVGGTARGMVRFEGGPPPAAPPSTTSVYAVDTSNSGLPMSSTGQVKPDWTFELKGLAGRRALRVGGLPSGWMLKGIRVDGTDVTDSGLDVKPGQEISDLEVILTNKVTEISGSVQDGKGAATDDFAVLVFPSDPQHWGWQSRHVRVARPDQNGRFLISGLPDGTYLAVALEYVEPGEETNPEFLERLKALATTVRLNDGEKKPLVLKVSAQ